jgi:hypothetical protein
VTGLFLVLKDLSQIVYPVVKVCARLDIEYPTGVKKHGYIKDAYDFSHGVNLGFFSKDQKGIINGYWNRYY